MEYFKRHRRVARANQRAIRFWRMAQRRYDDFPVITKYLEIYHDTVAELMQEGIGWTEMGQRMATYKVNERYPQHCWHPKLFEIYAAQDVSKMTPYSLPRNFVEVLETGAADLMTKRQIFEQFANEMEKKGVLLRPPILETTGDDMESLKQKHEDLFQQFTLLGKRSIEFQEQARELQATNSQLEEEVSSAEYKIWKKHVQQEGTAYAEMMLRQQETDEKEKALKEETARVKKARKAENN